MKANKQILDAIKTGMEIRKLYQESKNAGITEEQLEPFKRLIDQKIEAAIANAKRTVLSNYQGDDARKNELGNGLTIGLRWLAPRIERGLIVEIRQPPPALRVVGDEASEEAKKAASAQQALAEISQTLEFPKLAGEPLLRLTNFANDNLDD